jgi:hypothetical protein
MQETDLQTLIETISRVAPDQFFDNFHGLTKILFSKSNTYNPQPTGPILKKRLVFPQATVPPMLIQNPKFTPPTRHRKTLTQIPYSDMDPKKGPISTQPILNLKDLYIKKNSVFTSENRLPNLGTVPHPLQERPINAGQGTYLNNFYSNKSFLNEINSKGLNCGVGTVACPEKVNFITQNSGDDLL